MGSGGACSSIFGQVSEKQTVHNTQLNLIKESYMLKNSELVDALENELKGFKIAWDSGIQLETPWLVQWPKLTKEKKIREFACEDLKMWIKELKTERFVKRLDWKKWKNRSSIEQVFGKKKPRQITFICL